MRQLIIASAPEAHSLRVCLQIDSASFQDAASLALYGGGQSLEAYATTDEKGQKQVLLVQPGGSLHADEEDAVLVPTNPVIATGNNSYSAPGLVSSKSVP